MADRPDWLPEGVPYRKAELPLCDFCRKNYAKWGIGLFSDGPWVCDSEECTAKVSGRLVGPNELPQESHSEDGNGA